MLDINQLPGIERANCVPRDAHSISRSAISPNALKVLYRLENAGFYGFLVGGGVRDLLLGLSPKDFDIATDASPEEVRQLFKNSRIIGRRFKIVHIRFGREIIEATTFRAPHDANNEIADHIPRRQIKGLDSAHSREGMILRDNVYGQIDEDALRRDFTVNALYYTTNGFVVLDFSSGLEDLSARRIRIIGDAGTRYREDPVRMLRAIRFAAKLNFDIEESTAEPFKKLGKLLLSVSSARLFDETVKMFSTGYAVRAFELLQSSGLGEFIIGPTLEALDECSTSAKTLVQLALENTDKRLADDKSVTPYFLFAALLWPMLSLRQEQEERNAEFGHKKLGFLTIANEVIGEQLEYTAIPKRISFASREIWELQWKLENRNKKNVRSTFAHPRFRAAYDFLLLREAAGEDLRGCGQWWTDFQFGDTNQQEGLVNELPSPRRRKRRRKRNRSPQRNN